MVVTACGRICMHGKRINISTVLAGQCVGIKEVGEGIRIVSFMNYDLGLIDLEQKTLQPLDNPFGPRLSPQLAAAVRAVLQIEFEHALSSRAQLNRTALWCTQFASHMAGGAASMLLSGPRGTNITRSIALGASTPWKRIRCSRGRGTSAASRWLADSMLRDAVADLTSAVAERLVREEIERIKSATK